MYVKEFPDVQAKLDRFFAVKKQFHIGGILDVPAAGSHVSLSYTLLAPIEHTQRFIGATIDMYADAARKAYKNESLTTDNLFLKALITYLMPQWVNGIVLDQSEPNKIERILRSREKTEKFFKKEITAYDFEKAREFRRLMQRNPELFEVRVDGPPYDPEKKERTLFVPTPKYTRLVLGFDYRFKDLERMIDYEIDAE